MSPGADLRVAVAGSTGYIGMQCVALLAGHPGVHLSGVMARSHAGERYGDVVPGSTVDLRIDDSLAPDSADVVFSALPHTVAAAHAREWLSAGAVVIDLSADFRLRDPVAYQRWYGVEHLAPDLCGESVYGLVELHRGELARADLIAVPGCYPTATLLACAPALSAGLVEPKIVVDAKSGVSGAGRSVQLSTQFAEVNESVHAYGVSGHRHKSEMLEQLNGLGDGEVHLTFVPHLLPMTRGILVTAYMTPKPGITPQAVQETYAAFCAGQPFLREHSAPPATKTVTGTNLAALHAGWQDGTTVVTVAIDNLLKGAAGQAVQAFNVRFGFDEQMALPVTSQWP